MHDLAGLAVYLPVMCHDRSNAPISCQAVQQFQCFRGRRVQAWFMPCLIATEGVLPCICNNFSPGSEGTGNGHEFIMKRSHRHVLLHFGVCAVALSHHIL